MSEFSNNLQFYRKRSNLTQEMLAEDLGVSRQTISKWEAGTTYPEMDKILLLCNIFGCDVDTLLRGEAVYVDVKVNEKYDTHMKKFAKTIAFATFFIITGLAILILLTSRGLADTYAGAIFFVFIIVSVSMYITSGIEHSTFKRKHSQITPFYTEDEIDRVESLLPKQITAGVAMILIGVIGVILCADQAENILLLAVSGMMELIAIAVFLFIYGGMNYTRVNVEEYNKACRQEAAEKEAEQKTESIAGVIFLFATIIFLITGLVFHLWYINWIVYIIAALSVGIVNLIVANKSKKE